MNCYQLHCGHWQSEPCAYAIGDLIPGCIKCNTLRTFVIGFTGTATTKGAA